MDSSRKGRVLPLSAAAKRLRVPERTLRHRASRGRIPGAFKQGKLWKFPVTGLEAAVSTHTGLVDRAACEHEIIFLLHSHMK
jgi:helix-turn-helix protein